MFKAKLTLVQILSMLFLLAVGAGAAIRVILLSQAFGEPSVPLNDTAERDWSFGQLLPMLLLLLPLVSALEITRGAWNCNLVTRGMKISGILYCFNIVS